MRTSCLTRELKLSRKKKKKTRISDIFCLQDQARLTKALSLKRNTKWFLNQDGRTQFSLSSDIRIDRLRCSTRGNAFPGRRRETPPVTGEALSKHEQVQQGIFIFPCQLPVAHCVQSLSKIQHKVSILSAHLRHFPDSVHTQRRGIYGLVSSSLRPCLS